MPKSRKAGDMKGISLVFLASSLICTLFCSCRNNESNSQDDPTNENNNTYASTEYTNPDSSAGPQEVTQPSQEETRIPEEDEFYTEPDEDADLPTEGSPPTQPKQDTDEEISPTTQPTQEPTEEIAPTVQPTQEPTEGSIEEPTQEPTEGSTEEPTQEPTNEPTEDNGPIKLPVLPP